MKKINSIIDFLQKQNIIRLFIVMILVSATILTAKTAVQNVFNEYEQATVNKETGETKLTEETKGTKRKLPIYCVDTPEKKVAISFDAAWGADDTDNLLAILKEYNVKTTFFLCGYWVDKYPEEVKRIAEAGHEIGNHGNTHAHGAELSLENNKKEIAGVHEKIKNLLGVDMKLFRPPFGEYNNTVIEAATEMNYYTIQWDVDSHDWMNKGVDYEINRVLKNPKLGNGSIILFHNDAKETPIALPVILKGLQEMGYEIVPISELIHKENYYMDHEGRQKLNQAKE